MCVLRGHVPAAYRLRWFPTGSSCGIAAGHDVYGWAVSDLRMSRDVEISSCGLSRGRGGSAYLGMSSTMPGRDTGGFRPAREQRVMRSHMRGFFPEPVAAKV